MSFVPLSSAVRPDEKLVTVVVPHDFLLCLDDGRRVSVLAGTYEAPEVVADHSYSKANGLRRYAPVVSATASDEDDGDAAPPAQGADRMNGIQRNTPSMAADEGEAVARELARAQSGDAVEIVPVSVSLATMNAENRERWAIGPATGEG